MVKRIAVFFNTLAVLTIMNISTTPAPVENGRFCGLAGECDYIHSQRVTIEKDGALAETSLAFQAPSYEVED